jgi:hypothetical protein
LVSPESDDEPNSKRFLTSFLFLSLRAQRLGGEIREFIFTAEAQRGRAASESRSISRKDAKAAKAGD